MTDKLLNWYLQNFRPLPWRESRDPYRIWLSEIMLQQTTVAAALPYYDKFLKKYPTVDKLAKAPLSEVLQMWSGLGYYSRARNLHKAAQLFSKNKFPKTYSELIQYPGLGPYTARAVASFSFSEPAGVLDGNVIRFLSRYHASATEWWRPKGREVLQNYADSWVKNFDSSNVNQALIEIGATICTSQNPKCQFCPVVSGCASVGNKNTEALPLKKKKRATEIWIWEPSIVKNKLTGQLALTENHDLTFLKNHWAWPGASKRVKKAPKSFDFKHAVTHHIIYVKIKTKTGPAPRNTKWLTHKQIQKLAHTSLVKKVFSYLPPSFAAHSSRAPAQKKKIKTPQK